jgi:glutaryl-CoA dehydrogenase
VPPYDVLDLDSQLTDEEVAIRDAVKRYVDDRVLPNIGGWFEAGEFPTDCVREMGELGLLGMHLSGYGCPGKGAVAYGLACMELEAGDGGFRTFASVQGSLAMFAIHRFGTEEQKNRWLPAMARGEAVGCFALTEPTAGSDPSAMATTAERRGDEWRLNGTKRWVTSGSIADVAVIWARTEGGIQGFLLEGSTPGFEATDIPGKLSLRASVTSEITVSDCVVGEDALLPEARGLGAALTCLNEARYGIVWGAMGAARACFESAVERTKSRDAFGKPLAAFQITQQKLADMLVAISKGTLLALHLGRMKERGGLTPQQVSLGKLSNVRDAQAVAREARALLGADGITLDFPAMRHMNNLESVATYEGTAEVHSLVLGEAITGHRAFK